MTIIRPEGPREFTLMSHDRGLVLCDKFSGAVLCISYPEELQQLRDLLNQVATWKPKETP